MQCEDLASAVDEEVYTYISDVARARELLAEVGLVQRDQSRELLLGDERPEPLPDLLLWPHHIARIGAALGGNEVRVADEVHCARLEALVF